MDRFAAEAARVLRPGGILTWADLRGPAMMPALEAAFAHPALERIAAGELNAGVLAALDAMEADKQAEIGRFGPFRAILNEFAAMREYMGDTACVVDATFPVAEGEQGLRRHIERIRREAEDGVRSGCTHVILSDENQGPDRAAIPMILAVGGVHTHLVRSSLRTFTSLNVRCAEAIDVHYIAVLIGAGATTVNAYLAQESIADRHRRGLFANLWDVLFDPLLVLVALTVVVGRSFRRRRRPATRQPRRGP
jgi:hypothetical protein